MKIQWLSRVLLVALAVGAISVPVRADGIPVSGIAQLAGAIGASFQFSGPGLNVSSGTPGFPQDFFSCDTGAVCNMTLTVPSILNFLGPGSLGLTQEESVGSLSGRSANLIGGELIFAGSAFIPSSFTSGVIDIPVALAGTIQGYNLTNCPNCALGTPLWNLVVSGTGEAQFFSLGGIGPGNVAFNSVSYSFTGKAVVTPEPSSLLLFGSGLSLLGFAWRKRFLLHR